MEQKSRKRLSKGILPYKIHSSQTQKQTFLQRLRADVVLGTFDIKLLVFSRRWGGVNVGSPSYVFP